MSITLARPFELLRASRYTNPGDASAILPEVYGDFTSGGLRGPVPAVLIDTVNWVYAAAAHAVESITKVFVDDVEQVSGFTTSVSNNYESQGTIATIDFTSQPDGAVTWRGKGKRDATPALITNPITQLEDLLKTRSTYAASDFDSAALETARAVVSTLGYQTSWVVNDERQVAEWLTEWLFNAMGWWRVTGPGLLYLEVDDGNWPSTDKVIANVVARRDCVDGDDGVTWSADLQSLVNTLTVHYLWAWSLGSASSRITSEEDLVSKNIHGEVRKAVTLRGHRRAADVTTWAGILFDRQAFRTRVEGVLVRFTVDGPKLAHATIGDVVGFSSSWGPVREGGAKYLNELLRILMVRHDPMRGRSEVSAVDLGGYLTEDLFYDADVEFDADVWFGGGRSTAVKP